jgi:hypothetical protein
VRAPRFAALLAAVVILGWSTFASADTATAARLVGAYRTIETITSAGTVVGEHDGQTRITTWTFQPACPSGGCTTAVERETARGTRYSEELDPASGVEYRATLRGGLANCYTQSGAVRIADAYDVTATLTLDVTSVTGGVATAYRGSAHDHFAPNARAHGSPFCRATDERYTFLGTLTSGLPATAIPPVGAAITSPPASPPATTPLTLAPVAGPATGSVSSRVRRSSLTASLTPPAHTFGNPVRDVVNVAIAFAALVLITFPAQLFNRTFEENYDEIMAGWRRRVLRFRRPAAREPLSATVRRRLVFAAVTAAGAVLGSLLSPSAGLNATTVVSALATLLAILFGSGVSRAIATEYRRRRDRDATSHLQALPAGLLIALACVLISRLTDFQPGYLYGVVAGVVFSSELVAREEAHVVGLDHLATLTVSVAAWLIWVPVNHAASAADAGWALVLLDDVLGTLVVGGLVGTAINLVPLRFLPGAALWSWRRAAGLTLLLVAVIGVVAILLNPRDHASHGTHTALLTTLVLLVVFGAASVLFAQYWARRRELDDADRPPGGRRSSVPS